MFEFLQKKEKEKKGLEQAKNLDWITQEEYLVLVIKRAERELEKLKKKQLPKIKTSKK